jgi:2-polyprenyl-6-methoxyphenol hydroxylase-like FAD-dependent oxidoreductase
LGLDQPARERFCAEVHQSALELLDPLIRRKAADTPGVELILGRTAHALLHEGNVVRGIEVRDRNGDCTRLRARLVVGADGRGSQVAKLAGLHARTTPNARFTYGAHFDGPVPMGSVDRPTVCAGKP